MNSVDFFVYFFVDAIKGLKKEKRVKKTQKDRMKGMYFNSL